MALGGRGYGDKAEGKHLEKQQVIQAPRRRIPVMEVERGALICDAEGGVQRVIAVHRKNDVFFYKITFSDGTDTLCCADLAWVAWRAHIGTKKRTSTDADASGRVHGPAAARKYLTSDLIAGIKQGKRYRVPLCKPVSGQFNSYKIDPYLIGAFLGDASMPARSAGNCTLSNHPQDVEIVKHINTRLDIPLTPRSDGRSWGLSKKSVEYTRLYDMGLLGKRSWEKRLPPSACFAPIPWRWELLRGLMDTDGWVESNRCAYYTTTSPHLRDGVTQLARSLGCFVTASVKHPTYTHNGEKRDGRTAWTLRIKSATPEKLFFLHRKRAIAEGLSHQSLAKEIVSIEEWGVDSSAHLTVDHPNSLYLTNDYTITHNTAAPF